MKDQEYLKLLKQVKKELRKRYVKPCKELDINCHGCQSWILISGLENEIDLVKSIIGWTK